MRWTTRALLAFLVGATLCLYAAPAFTIPDFAWSPSYVDDADGDFLVWLVSAKVSLSPVERTSLLPLLVAIGAAVVAVPSPRSWLIHAPTPPPLTSAGLAASRRGGRRQSGGVDNPT